MTDGWGLVVPEYSASSWEIDWTKIEIRYFLSFPPKCLPYSINIWSSIPPVWKIKKYWKNLGENDKKSCSTCFPIQNSMEPLNPIFVHLALTVFDFTGFFKILLEVVFCFLFSRDFFPHFIFTSSWFICLCLSWKCSILTSSCMSICCFRWTSSCGDEPSSISIKFLWPPGPWRPPPTPAAALAFLRTSFSFWAAVRWAAWN